MSGCGCSKEILRLFKKNQERNDAGNHPQNQPTNQTPKQPLDLCKKHPCKTKNTKTHTETYRYFRDLCKSLELSSNPPECFRISPGRLPLCKSCACRGSPYRLQRFIFIAEVKPQESLNCSVKANPPQAQHRTGRRQVGLDRN